MLAGERDPGLYRKLAWLTLFRVVTITVLLGGTAAMSWRARSSETDPGLTPLYVVIVAAYLSSIALALFLRRRSGLVPVAYGNVALDVGVAAGLVSVTGRSESIFVLLFSLAVVNAAILLFRRGALVAAVLSIGAYALVASPQRPFPGTTVFAHAAAFVATAVLAASLAEQLRTTRERLAARESDLASLTALHESIVQSMTGGLLTLDPAGRVTFLNRAGEQMVGMQLERVRGRPARDALPMFGERVVRDEIDLVNARGQRLRLGYSSFPLLDRVGALMGTAVIFQDLTQLRTMEEAMKRSERLADLGRVAAGLAHELRNPLASLSGSIELLRDQGAEDERRLMDIALREAARLNGLVSEFLRFARPPPLRRERTDLSGLVAETLDVFAHDPEAAGVRLERALTAAPVECDPGQIRQVLWNLLRNAAQAVGPGGGRVRVACAPEAGGGASFEVADDGPGIAGEDLARVFLPFHTTKPGGSGLGLAIVQRIVDAHAGRVTVESAPGEGARFRVLLRATCPDGAAAG
jgi:two-component system, NtrC family, sensor histidine kinase PilS